MRVGQEYTARSAPPGVTRIGILALQVCFPFDHSKSASPDAWTVS